RYRFKPGHLLLRCPHVIASEAKQSSFLRRDKKAGLLRRYAPRNDVDVCRLHLFKKFSGNPGRDQSIAISSPLPDSVMYAVFSSGPPKAMLVVTRSPVGTCSTIAPSGAITEMQPEISVATQTLPFASTASESNIWTH